MPAKIVRANIKRRANLENAVSAHPLDTAFNTGIKESNNSVDSTAFSYVRHISFRPFLIRPPIAPFKSQFWLDTILPHRSL